MKKTIKLTESQLTKLIKRVVKENVDNRPDEFYSHINELINYEYSDMDPRDAIDVLENIISSLRARQHREKTGSKFINKDDVMKNWNMNEEIATPKGGLSRKMYTLYNKEKMNVEIVSGPMGIDTGLYQITTKDSDNKYYNLIFDCRKPDSLKIKGRPLSSVENTDLTGEMLSKFCK